MLRKALFSCMEAGVQIIIIKKNEIRQTCMRYFFRNVCDSVLSEKRYRKKKTRVNSCSCAHANAHAGTPSQPPGPAVRPSVSAVMINGGPRSRNLFALPLDGKPNGDQHAYFYPRRSHTSKPKRCPGAMG